jgi:drug/metabolite transporter (DMT)-like permease
MVFGSLVAFSAYVWLLAVSTPARVGTYTYVNPVVALALGWWLADEALTTRSLVASAVILGAVVIITTESSRVGSEAVVPESPKLSQGAEEQ